MANPLILEPPPKKRKPFVPKEYDEQVEVFLWAHGDPGQWTTSRNGKGYWARLPVAARCTLPGIDMLYATLNGVRLPIGLAVKMSKAGLKRGPLDINLDVARGDKFGLRIEMKRIKGGVISDEQIAWAARLREEGYLAVTAYGASQAIKIIAEYLKQPRTMVIPFTLHDEEICRLDGYCAKHKMTHAE